MPATIDHYTSGGTPIEVELFMPSSPGRHPAALVLHGTFGLRSKFRADIVSFAEALAAKGTAAILPHYFDRTATDEAGDATAEIADHLEAWKSACRDALAFARRHPAVDPGRLGILGFSLGGHLSLDLAMSPPGTGVKCVVDFFGPTRLPPLQGDRALLPPVLIHHGDDDRLVWPDDSLDLVSQLRAAGKVEGLGYRFVRYPHQGHGFTGAALANSRTTSVDFLTGIV